MFLTVTPNPCIERTITIGAFDAGAVYRIPPEKVRFNVGGKGINATRVAGAFGAPACALLWAGVRQREWIEKQLRSEAVIHEVVEAEADTRHCLTVLDGRGGKTEIIEEGFAPSAAVFESLYQRFLKLLPAATLVAVCGSYPHLGSAVPASAHLQRLCAAAQEAAVPCLLDSPGALLRDVLPSTRPWCIKPNVAEAELLLQHKIDGREAEVTALAEMRAMGAQRVLLSCGARGCYFASAAATLFFAAPVVNEVSAVGCGDSLVGSMAAKLLQGTNEFEAVRWGVAAGAANATQQRAGFCRVAEAASLLDAVQVEILES